MARYWKTTVTVVVLTEGDEAPDYDGISDLERLHEDVIYGDASGQVISSVCEEVSEEGMARLLEGQGSDPSFLIMPLDDDDGDQAEDENHNRVGLGTIECRYCGSKDCNFDCDESQAGGFQADPETALDDQDPDMGDCGSDLDS